MKRDYWSKTENNRCRYFVNQSNGTFIFCLECETIKNGIPLCIGRLPSILKKDRNGNLYFRPGTEIKKLLTCEFPYYNFAFTTWIVDQNSKGYIVGNIDTYSGNHAFLAIPEK